MTEATDAAGATGAAWRYFVQAHVPSLSAVLGLLSQSLCALYDGVVVKPLRRLYRTGPTFGGVGFWRNASDADVCAALTNVEAKFWHANAKRCARVVEEDFQSYLVVFETVLYFALLYNAARQLWRVLCAATHRSLRKHGFVERYSPRTLAWLHTRFPSTQRHYNELDADGNEILRHEHGKSVKQDSPYSVYGTD